MNNRFENKVILITGAGSGLGAASAKRLAEEGAILSLMDINEAGLANIEAIVSAAAPNCQLRLSVVNAADEQAMKEYIDSTAEQFGHINGLYNNAGIEGVQNQSVEEYPSDGFDHVIDVNVKGVFYGLKYTLPHLVRQGSGAIVNVSSVAGIRAVPNQVGYGASKHAVAGMTKSAAIEYGKHGISVNAISPGVIMTDMVISAFKQVAGEEHWEAASKEYMATNPSERFGDPDEVAALVAFLLSQDAAYLNGAVIPIDGGQSVAY